MIERREFLKLGALTPLLSLSGARISVWGWAT